MAKSPIDIAKETGLSLSQVLQQIGRDSGWGDQYLNTGPIVAGDGNTWLGNGDGTYNVYANDPSANNAPASYNGRAFDKYSATGEKIGGGSLSGYKNGSPMDYAPFGMVAAGFAPALLAGAGAAGAGGAAAAGNSFDGGLLNSAVMNGVGEGAATTAASAVAPATFNAAADSQLANVAIDAAGGNSLAGYTAAGISPAVATGGAGLTAGGAGLLGTGISAADALKYGAPLLGALAGSQGVKQTQTGSSRMDPRMDQFVYGQGTTPGLLNYAQNQLAQGMSPAGQAGWQSIMSKGMGLLNQPVAQNGFAAFTKGKY